MSASDQDDDDLEVYRPDLNDPEGDRIMALTDGLDSLWATRTAQDVEDIWQLATASVRAIREGRATFLHIAVLEKLRRTEERHQRGESRPPWPIPNERVEKPGAKRSASKSPAEYIAIRGRRVAERCQARGITDPTDLTVEDVAEMLGYANWRSARNAFHQRKVRAEQIKAEAYRVLCDELR